VIAAGYVIAGFPNPIGWTIDKVKGFITGAATEGFEVLIGGLVAWVTDAVVWVVGGVFNFFIDSADPNVQADWFLAEDGPYGTMAGIGAALMIGFLLVGVTQGALSGDVGGMLRRMALDLPASVLGMVGLVTATQVLIRLTDELSTAVMGNFQDDIVDFTAVVASLSRLGGGVASAFVVLVLGLVTVLAGVILVAELTVRSALIYIVVALAPLVFAARLWPALQDVARKLLYLLVALILSKLAMAVALSVAAAAAVGTGSGGEVTALPEPEAFAEDPGGSVTQAVGILLAAVSAFGVAAFSPLTVAKLLPMTEAAIVGQGLRGMPVRGAQQAASTAYYSQMLSSMRLRRLAHGERPKTPPAPTAARFPAGQLALGAGPRRPALPAGSRGGPRSLGRGPRPMPPASSPGGSGAGGGGGAPAGASPGAGAASAGAGTSAGAAAGSGAGGAAVAGGGSAAAGAAAGPVGVAAAAGVAAVRGGVRAVQRGADAVVGRAAGAVDTAAGSPGGAAGTATTRRTAKEAPPRRQPGGGGGDEGRGGR
jgi:hypothetical protein